MPSGTGEEIVAAIAEMGRPHKYVDFAGSDAWLPRRSPPIRDVQNPSRRLRDRFLAPFRQA